THKSNCNVDRFGMGWQVDWHDVGGNPIGGGKKGSPTASVGTPTDNTVHYASPVHCGVFNGKFNEGTWQGMDHTYPPNTDAIVACVVTYDLHQNTGKAIVAGGPNHNTDNSVEKNQTTPLTSDCFRFGF